MAFSFRYTRYSAICHLILGGLCVIFGIADRASMYNRRAFQTEGVIAIWMGAWFFITGILGFLATQRIPNSERPKTALVGTYLAFGIVSTVFAGVIIICYGIGIAILQAWGSCSEASRYVRVCKPNHSYDCTYRRISVADECRTSVGLAAMILIFAAAEFGVGIWSSICCCMNYNGCCCDTSAPPTGQIVYLQTQGGPTAAYVMTQGPNGMPVAVPAMTGGAVYPVPNQAMGGQGYMMQNPQGASAMAPTQQMQVNIPTSVSQQPVVTTHYASGTPPPGYKV